LKARVAQQLEPRDLDGLDRSDPPPFQIRHHQKRGLENHARRRHRRAKGKNNHVGVG
jgi:hypothetical protein